MQTDPTQVRVTVPTAVKAAVDACLIGGNHLAALIGKPHPPATATTAEALAHYGDPGPAFQTWCAWRGIMALRDAWDAWTAEVDPPPTNTRPSPTVTA